ncbi:MAG: hypothetical protein GY820_20180 [Gammaproteobacteria bacterium]|nr:hypothetical protein [Gammaproteobacteria bacterium]
MEPYEGYWVKAKQENVFLKFPHDNAVQVTATRNQGIGKQLKNRISKISFTRQAIAESGGKPPSPIGSFSDSSKVADSSGCFISEAAHGTGTQVYTVGGGMLLMFFGLCVLLGLQSPVRDDRK